MITENTNVIDYASEEEPFISFRNNSESPNPKTRSSFTELVSKLQTDLKSTNMFQKQTNLSNFDTPSLSKPLENTYTA